MKKLFLSLAIAVSSLSSFAQGTIDAAPTSKAEIIFEKTSHNFGDIKQGDVVSYVFKFKNTGKDPLILNNVTTTCGCTVPSWPKEPIMPGKSGEISASFNSSGKMGLQNKVITVLSNAKNAPSQVTLISNVLLPDQKPATPAAK